MLFDAERLRLNEAAANKLLKTLEEPPPRAVIILVTSGADQLLPTIRSRCQRVDFAYLGADAVAAALVADGIPAERADLLARLAGGRIDRARALNGRIGPVRDAFVAAASAIDGTGGAVAEQAELVQDALQTALSGLEDGAGRRRPSSSAPSWRPRATPSARAAAQLRRLEERHKRTHRRARIDALLEGITALETVYRDALAGSADERLNTDRDVLVARPHGPPPAALDACRDARQAIAEFNPNETLLVERLFLHLQPAGRGRRPEALRERLTRGRYTRRRAGVAQMAEQLTRNEQAKGSSPFSGSIRRTTRPRCRVVSRHPRVSPSNPRPGIGRGSSWSTPRRSHASTVRPASPAVGQLLQNPETATPSARRGERFQVVGEAVEFMDRNLDRPITTVELCDSLCVSRRTIFYAFKEVYGLTPMAFLRATRLNMVRRS